MNLPSFVYNVEEEDVETNRDTKYLLSLLPHVKAENFISTHKPNVHVVINTEMDTLEIYLPSGGMLYCSLIDLEGDTNPWKA